MKVPVEKVSGNELTKKTIDFEKIMRTVERISQNRFIIAIFLVIDGFVFLFNPAESVENMGRAIAGSMVLAAGAMIIAKIVAKERFVRFLPALILLAAGVLMYFYPNFLSAYFRLLLALVIVIQGTINLLDVLGLTQAREFVTALRDKAVKFFSRIKNPKQIDEGMEGEAGKILNPLYKIVSESKWHKAVYFAINLLAVILGVMLLVRPNISITILGVIMIYAGSSNLVMAFRTRKISKELRNKNKGEAGLQNDGVSDKNEQQKG